MEKPVVSFAEFCYKRHVALGLRDDQSIDLVQAEADYLKEYPPLKTCVFVDDRKFPKVKLEGYGNWIWLKSYVDLVEYLSYRGIPEYISFDHDLHEEHERDFERNELAGIAAIEYEGFEHATGLRCIQYLCEFAELNGLPLQTIGIHCANERPMGALNMYTAAKEFIDHYKSGIVIQNDIPRWTLEEKLASEQAQSLLN